jgi:hypothetical protein
VPPGQCSSDIFLLTLFRTASHKDDEALAIFAEVNPVARTKVNPVLVNTRSNALGVGKILVERVPKLLPLSRLLLYSSGQTMRQTDCIRPGQGIRVLRP